MPTTLEPPVVAQSARPRAASAGRERLRDPPGRLERRGRRIGRDHDLGRGRLNHRSCRRHHSGPWRDDRGRGAQRAALDGVAATRLDRLREQVDLGHPRREEVPVERLDAVEPDADVDRLGLGGHVGPQFRASPLGQELDAQRRPRRHLRDHRPHDDGHLGPAVRQGRHEAPPEDRLRVGTAGHSPGA